MSRNRSASCDGLLHSICPYLSQNSSKCLCPRRSCKPRADALRWASETPGVGRRQQECQSRITERGRKEYSCPPPLALRFGSNIYRAIDTATCTVAGDGTRQHVYAAFHWLRLFLSSPLLEIPRPDLSMHKIAFLDDYSVGPDDN